MCFYQQKERKSNANVFLVIAHLTSTVIWASYINIANSKFFFYVISSRFFISQTWLMKDNDNGQDFIFCNLRSSDAGSVFSMFDDEISRDV